MRPQAEPGRPRAASSPAGRKGSVVAELMSLSDAVESLVSDGDSVALEGFTHLIPFEAGHEIIRQGRRELELIRMTPDLLYDQMIGMGVARRLVFSYGGNPGVGGLHRFRDAIEHEWPRPVEIEEHSHAGMANRYAAGAADMPFAVMRGYVGTDLVAHTYGGADHLSVHRRALDRGAGARVPMSPSSTPRRRTGKATFSCGASPASRRKRSWPRSDRW